MSLLATTPPPGLAARPFTVDVYGVRRVQIPLALAISVWVHLLEIGGMWEARRGRPITETAYR